MKCSIRLSRVVLVCLCCCWTVAAQTPSKILITQSAPRLSNGEEKSLMKFMGAKDRGAGHGFNLFSRDAERRMGDEAAVELEEGAKMLRNEALISYLNGLGRKLAEQSSARETEFRFKVFDCDDVNAMALPNGVVYVNSGLLLVTRSEAELAGVLAHEIAHVAARHATRAATRRGIWGLASLGVVMASGGLGAAVQPAVGMTGDGFLMKFSRSSEREADLLGLTYLDAAGYDPNSYVSILERMSVREAPRGKMAKLAATHPATEDRIRRVQRAIELMLTRRETYLDSSSDFDAARRIVMELTHPDMLDAARPVLRIRPKEAATPDPQSKNE